MNFRADFVLVSNSLIIFEESKEINKLLLVKSARVWTSLSNSSFKAPWVSV